MDKKKAALILASAAVVVSLALFYGVSTFKNDIPSQATLAGGASADDLSRFNDLTSAVADGSISFILPEDGVSYPRNFAAPDFEWTRGAGNVWLVRLLLPDGRNVSAITRSNSWRPDDEVWKELKEESAGQYVSAAVYGMGADGRILSSQPIRFRVSTYDADPYVVFRIATYPFDFPNKKPSIYYRDISKLDSYYFFKSKEFCFSCHTFSDAGDKATYSTRYYTPSGRVMGVDMVFSAGDEAYFQIADESGSKNIKGSQIGTWTPDGSKVVLEVNSEYWYTMDSDRTGDFYYSEGDISVLDIASRILQPLKGASEKGVREFFPSLSADGKTLSFGSQEVFNSEGGKKITKDADIYVLDFNDGEGGVPKPLEGASIPGVREYFQRYSPDGKWLVFNRIDGEGDTFAEPTDLYILPAKGGVARPLNCSRHGVLNSLAYWSSNSRWIVFASRRYNNESRLYFAEIDDDGNAYPAAKMPNQEIGQLLAYHQPYLVKDFRKVMEIRNNYNRYFNIAEDNEPVRKIRG